MNEIFFYIIISLFGLVAGSFLNVCVYRLPRQKSIVRPPSFCPQCKQTIKWFDNIPVISFLILRGRCRYCQKKISCRYPFIEILTALIFCLNFYFFGMTAPFFTACLFSAGLIVATFIDFEFQLIPDFVSFGGIILGLALSVFYPQALFGVESGAFVNSLLGVIVGGGSIYLLGFIGTLLFRKESMGFGDVKLMAMIGAFLGWKLVLLCFFAAPVLGSAWGVILKFKYKKEIMPYGPFLSWAALICLYFGKDILNFFFLITF